MAGCCGQHAVCEKSQLSIVSADYEYYDDEELDEFEEPAQEAAPRTRRPSPFASTTASTAAPAAPAAAAAPAYLTVDEVHPTFVVDHLPEPFATIMPVADDMSVVYAGSPDIFFAPRTDIRLL